MITFTNSCIDRDEVLMTAGTSGKDNDKDKCMRYDPRYHRCSSKFYKHFCSFISKFNVMRCYTFWLSTHLTPVVNIESRPRSTPSVTRADAAAPRYSRHPQIRKP